MVTGPTNIGHNLTMTLGSGRGGGGGAKSTMGIKNFNLERSEVRKSVKIGLNHT